MPRRKPKTATAIGYFVKYNTIDIQLDVEHAEQEIPNFTAPLQNHIHDNVVSISGYNVIRRDIFDGQHGCVCVYIRNSIKYNLLYHLMNTDIEAIWLELRPSRLPRGWMSPAIWMNVSSNLKWNEHIYQVITKARKRLYFLTQLKRAKVGTNELVLFYCTCIRPILEYASPVFHNGLTKYLSNDLEMVQKRAMRITFPWTSYTDALPLAGLQQLDVRRDELTKNFSKRL